MSGELAMAADRSSAPSRVRCSHCALPVPVGLVEEGVDEQFCCGACRAVWEAIHGCGLERYYEMRDRQGAEGQQAKTTGRGYEEFDDPAFAQLYCKDLGGNTRSVDLFLEGVHCVACVWLVEKLPDLERGVLEARLDMGRSMVRVVWDAESVRLSGIARALDRLGYVPHAAKGASARRARQREDRGFLTRLAIAGALAGNAMLMATPAYFGLSGGTQEEFRQLFRWASMGLAVLSVLWPGRVFFRGALTALRTRSRHLDLPIALGLSVGLLSSTVNTLRGTGEIYFDSITVLVFLLLCGRWIQHRQQRAATDAVELLYSLTPMRARVWEAGTTREVAIEAVGPGAIVEVRAEESFPADGEIVEGSTSVDQSILTGESRPVRVGVGERVSAGSVNLAGRVLVRVEAAGAETRVGRLMKLVEESALRRAPIVSAADRIAGWFVVGVVGLAGSTLAAWLVIDPPQAVGHALALLIVTCPCALGLATPLVVTVAVGRAARRGIMIKGGEVLERLARPGTILLDKTGTITEGRHRLVEWTGDESVKPVIAAVEAGSSHPIAVALVAALSDERAGRRQVDQIRIATDVRQSLGKGVSGMVDGVQFDIGSAAWVRSRCVAEHPSWVQHALMSASQRALTPIVIARDGVVVAVAALGDVVRRDARASVAQLRDAGWRVRIVSGDDARVVRAVGAQLGIEPEDAIGETSPEGKVRAVEAALAEGTVVMVGDGVNDAAALARAGVGVAVSGGAEASLAAADVYMRHAGLGPIVELCLGSRQAVRLIYTNLGVSLAYNAVAASLAMVGVINALAAAVIMPVSGLTVLAIALRGRTFGGPPCP